MAQFLRIPKVQLSILLALIYLSALRLYPKEWTIYLLLSSLGFCILFDLVFTYIRKDRLFVPFAAITSGLIIALIVDLNAKWYELALICAFSMASKNYLRFSGKHIFNPAGFGLLSGGIVLGLPVSWWGVSSINFQFPISNFQILLPFLILISPLFVSAYRMRRFVSITAFLLTYILLSGSFISFLDPTVLFFSLVMLPEPMTSPIDYKRQAMYGVMVGVLSYLLSVYPSFAGLLPDVLIPALLLGNLVFFKFR